MEEPVHTVWDFYDGPTSGVADFRGQPHWFERQFDVQQDEWSDIYALHPISAKALSAEIEADEIFQAWNSAFMQGLVSRDSAPALPSDRARHEQLSTSFERSADRTILVRGLFSSRSSASGSRLLHYTVEWTNMTT